MSLPAPPSATPEVSAAPVVASSRFVELYRALEITRFHSLNDAVLVETPRQMVRVDGEKAVDVTRWFTNIVDATGGVDPREPGSTLWSLTGQADDMRMRVAVHDMAGIRHRLFSRKGGVWSEQVASERFLAVSHVSETPLASGATLFQSLEKGRVAFEVEGPRPAFVPWLTKGKTGCPSRILYHATVRELEDGSFVGAGQACAGPRDKPPEDITPGWKMNHAGDGPIALEMWRRGDAQASFEILPGKHKPELINGAHYEIFGTPNDLWLATMVEGGEDGRFWSGYVAHYDGTQWGDVTPARDDAITKFIRTSAGLAAFGSRRAYLRERESWTPIEPPRGAWLAQVMVAGDSILAIHEGALFRWRTSERAFLAVELPEVAGRKARARELAATKSGDAFLIASTGNEGPNIVFRWPAGR